MRAQRLLGFFIICASIAILIHIISRPKIRNSGSSKSSKLRAHFSFNSPLFPSSAIISLTDDNSTFFLSRPAAFGSELPDYGLSGRLWVGRGFGEDPLGRVGVETLPDGELGCSDLPGWEEGFGRPGKTTPKAVSKQKKIPDDKTPSKRSTKDDRVVRDPADESDIEEDTPVKPVEDDGTDNYLQPPAPDTETAAFGDSSISQGHADIQSIQESAEIAGKVVLLSRGGCGFLEKVKWAQRRGGIAVIVGDNIPGGQLVTMYAKGDTSNVTIPALFTSYTTAHLLSSLIPSGGHFAIPPANAQPIGDDATPSKGKKPQKHDSASSATKELSKKKQSVETKQDPSKSVPRNSRSWLRSALSHLGFGGSSNPSGNTRPPNSGQHDWIVAKDWEEVPESTKRRSSNKESRARNSAGDDFVIGVHDWRNPDLTNTPNPNQQPNGKQEPSQNGPPTSKDLKTADEANENPKAAQKSNIKGEQSKAGAAPELPGKGWLSAFSHTDAAGRKGPTGEKQTNPANSRHTPLPTDQQAQDELPIFNHEGLWVTLTPTSMSSSPFIDTLLVLVVSPLITLTVVYTMLFIRSRIRRRRWRAPKSVVERLPVRTYHTIPSAASSSSISTPVGSSPTTPLLQQSSILPRPGLSRSQSRHRPRSRTTSEVPEQVGSSSGMRRDDEELLNPDTISLTESEKREKGLAQWRRRYGGRQRDCVVCLEEYVDGVSRVMSLPCGHEFHAECITPWLTTRRRTCPICKGDVVRSLARASGANRPPSSSQSSTDEDDTLDLDTAALLREDTDGPPPDDSEEELELGASGAVAAFHAWQGRSQRTWAEWRERVSEWWAERRRTPAERLDRDR